MPRPLKVFSWTTAGDYQLPSGARRQLRLVVAATSKTAAGRIMRELGAKAGTHHDLSETGEPRAVAAAMAVPGTVLADGTFYDRHSEPFVRFENGYGQPIPEVRAALAAHAGT